MLEWTLWNVAIFYHRQAQHSVGDPAHEHALRAQKFYKLASANKGGNHDAVVGGAVELEQMLGRWQKKPDKLPISGIHVIHLSGQTDRRARLESRFEHSKLAGKYDVHWFVDSPLMKDDIVQERLALRLAAQKVDGNYGKMWDVESGVLYTEQQLARYIANAASHEAIWKQAMKEDIDAVMIFENDARLITGFEQKILDAIPQLPYDWELLMLDAMSSPVAYAVLDPNTREGWKQCENCTLTGGYIIKKSAMQKTLAALEMIPQMFAEELLLYVQRTSKAFTYLPLLCVQEMVDTVIQSAKHMEKLKDFHKEHYFTRYGHLYPPIDQTSMEVPEEPDTGSFNPAIGLPGGIEIPSTKNEL
jgi:GR25 family glycosyltransferase involved in LPS biosynthesis